MSMRTARAQAWDISTPGEIALHDDARAHLPFPPPAVVTTYRFSVPPDQAVTKDLMGPYVFRVDVFRQLPFNTAQTVCIIEPSAPAWAEAAVEKYLDQEGNLR